MKFMFLRKLGVILLKNLLLRRTQWLITALELLLPIICVGLVVRHLMKLELNYIEYFGKSIYVVHICIYVHSAGYLQVPIVLVIMIKIE